ncbi:MAG: NAD-dependent epimerase/dehydratase family protein [Kofleriaceae bacterium]
MRAAITGVSGLLGSNLRAALSASKIDVVAVQRSDFQSADAMAKLFAGCDVVFHCAAMVTVKREVTPEMTDANVTGTDRVIEACRAANVPRLVHVSSVVAIGLSTNGKPCDETARWNFDELGLLDAYAITKHQAEERVHAAVKAGLDAVIVNPTYMFGPMDARPSSGKLIVNIVERKVPSWTDGYNNFVDVRDVVRGMIAAWKQGTRGERYILGGHDMTYKQCFETIARVAGVKPPRFRAPVPVAKLLGAWGDLTERFGRDPVVNSTQIRYAYTDKFRFTSDKAKKELGYTIGPLEPAIRDAIAWFRENGKL